MVIERCVLCLLLILIGSESALSQSRSRVALKTRQDLVQQMLRDGEVMMLALRK